MRATQFHILLCSTALAAAAPVGAQVALAPADARSGPARQLPSPTPDDKAQPDSASPSAEIVVTGSRVDRAGFTAPTPTTVLSGAALETRAFPNVGAALNEIPAFRPSASPTSGTLSLATSGGIYLDLRGLGTQRTLVLVDRNRFVPSNSTGSVNTNLIPTALIDRADTVTGGASAQWGSDAVAGVVNLILKSKIEGVQGSGSYGVTDRNDNREYALSLAAGVTFADGRGRIVAGADLVRNNGAPPATVARDWGALEFGTIQPLAPRAAGVPSRVFTAGLHFSGQLTPGGIITAVAGSTANPLVGTAFNPDGSTYTFTRGSIVNGNQQVGGDNAGQSLQSTNRLANPFRRYVGLVKGEYDVTDAITGFFQVGYGYNHATGNLVQRRDQANLTISINNAFLPAAVRARILGSNPAATTFTIGRLSNDIGIIQNDAATNTYTARAGVRGRFGRGWSWDVSAQHGENHLLSKQVGNSLNPNFAAAIDAVRDASGNIVCNPAAFQANYALNPALFTYSVNGVSGRNTPTAGCSPLNVFGAGSPSASAIAYVTGTSFSRQVNKQDVVAANLTGEPFSTWAGPVSLAFGAEYRRESLRITTDAFSPTFSWITANQAAVRGSNNVKEVYAEAVVPWLKDSPIGRALDTQLAARFTSYRLGGKVVSWKLGANYTPFDGLRLRITRSRDIRAPNIPELFAGGLSTNASVVDLNGLSKLTPVITVGNAGLKPEKANTTTAGVVVSPSFLPGLSASADHYAINIAGVIAALSGQNIVDRCGAGAAELCALISGNPGFNGAPSSIAFITSRNLNFNRLISKGWDIAGSYRRPFVVGGDRGAITLSALGTHVEKLTTVDSAGAIDRSGQNVAKWSWTFNVTLDYARLTLNANVRTISRGIRDTTLIGPDNPAYSATLPNSINDNVVPAVQYLNLGASYSLLAPGQQRLQLFVVMNNVFDRDPPPGLGGNAGTGGNVLYDVLGRAYRAGVRFQF